MASILRKQVPATLREVRVFGCQTSPASAGVRAFIKSSYPSIKAANPTLPILIREAAGTPARAFVRFDKGVEKSVALDGVSSADEVEKKIAALVQ
ncbi:NADH dehydrogenase (ubiquinone) 1 alpha subcomplex subunit 2 [Pseudohyphozyma bogoriensis]|nr:NADH dehydrogenase (ubiquinone) 1 alpha subcomplex subunit 2 [Pseudohyphozyma bogoriensis]